MVGSAIVRRLKQHGVDHLVTRTHTELDLCDQQAVRALFRDERIEHVVLSAAKVGGIHANSVYPAEFIYSNLMIQTNVLHEAWRAGIAHLLFLGSSCIYPKYSPQPMREEYLLTGALESTNEPYAVAKIAGIKMCEAYNRQYGTHYHSVMPTNLFGPGDNYHLENSHVIPAMLRKFHLARLAAEGNLEMIHRDEQVYGPIPEEIRVGLGLGRDGIKPGHSPQVVLWGTGEARREFLHVEDMAEACLLVMGLGKEFTARVAGSELVSFVNIGAGHDLTIRETAEILREITGFDGEVLFDTTRPDGTPRKLLDCSRINSLGWQPRYSLKEGLQQTYSSYLAGLASP